MHSWRVLILPFMEEQALYDQYDFSEPWDGPNNRRLIPLLPSGFRCPEQIGRNTSETNYVAVVGPRTAWPGTESTKLANFADGTQSTIMLVEVVNSGIPWTAPQDLSYEQALCGLQQDGGMTVAGGHPTSGRLYAPTGATIGFADGHVEFLRKAVPKEQWRAVLRRDDDLPRSFTNLSPYSGW